MNNHKMFYQMKQQRQTHTRCLILSSLLFVVSLATIARCQQQQQSTATAAATTTNNAGLGAASASAVATSGQPLSLNKDLTTTSSINDNFQAYKQSPYFLNPFDQTVLALPKMQLDFVRRVCADDMQLFREILNEAIETRKKLAPSVKLMLKYASRLLKTFIGNRRQDLALSERIEPSGEFFQMLANLAEQVVDRSGQVKRERGYTKDNINTDEFRLRVESVFDYIQKVINTSPMGAYMRWNELRLFMDEANSSPRFNKDLIEEAADLTAVSSSIEEKMSSLRLLTTN